MTKVQESPEPAVSAMEGVIQEYRERIWQALETDVNKLKERAERDSDQVVVRAKEEADRFVAQAKQEARAEADRIIAEAKNEAAQIIKGASEEAAEARQEAARVITETREKTAQIVKELIEYGTTRAQSELVRITSEAVEKTSRIITQVNNSIEQIIGDTGTNIKTELERLTVVIAESETKLQIQTKEIEVKSRQATVEASAPAAPVSDKTDSPIEESADEQLFEGCLKLEVVPPFNQAHIRDVPEWLPGLRGVKVKSTDSYARANRRITACTIELEHPLPLLKILSAMPSVKDASEHKGNIVITLK